MDPEKSAVEESKHQQLPDDEATVNMEPSASNSIEQKDDKRDSSDETIKEDDKKIKTTEDAVAAADMPQYLTGLKLFFVAL